VKNGHGAEKWALAALSGRHMNVDGICLSESQICYNYVSDMGGIQDLLRE